MSNESVTEEKKESFPVIPKDNSGMYYFDQENGTWWMGLRIDQFDFFGAAAFIRAAEYQVWSIYKQIGQQIAMRQKLAAQTPPVGQHGGGILGRFMHRKH